MKEPKKPWKAMIIPTVNWPCMVSHTPKARITVFSTVLTAWGIMPRYWFSREKRTFWVLTDA